MKENKTTTVDSTFYLISFSIRELHENTHTQSRQYTADKRQSAARNMETKSCHAVKRKIISKKTGGLMAADDRWPSYQMSASS